MRWIMVVALLLIVTACTDEDDPTTTERTDAVPTATSSLDSPDPTATAEDPTSTTEPVETPTPESPTPSPPEAPTPTPTATSTPAPTATPVTTANIEVGKWIMLEASYGGTTYIMGDVVNSGDATAQSIDVVISLYDAAGTILNSRSASSVLPLIPAGQKSPFSATFFDTDPSAVADVRFQVQFSKHDPNSFLGSLYTIDLEIVQVNWTPERITGEIRNSGETTVEFVEVIVIGYTVEGEVFGVESTYADLDILTPGLSSPFTTRISGYEGEPASIEAYASGRKD